MIRDQRNTVGAVALIGLGALFLAGQAFNIDLWSLMGTAWPLVIAIPGVVFIALALGGGRKTAGFIFPGVIITGTAGILLYQNATGHWESWAYVWTLYPVLVGVGLIFNGTRTGSAKEAQTGRQFVSWGLVGFVAAAAFFELLIFQGNASMTRWLLPLVLVGAGVFMLMKGRGGSDAKEKRKLSDIDDLPRVNGVHRNGRLSQSETLRRQIDEALAEDDEPAPSV